MFRREKTLISKILLPHYDTESSEKALEKSKEFAKALNAELYILHIIEIFLFHHH